MVLWPSPRAGVSSASSSWSKKEKSWWKWAKLLPQLPPSCFSLSPQGGMEDTQVIGGVSASTHTTNLTAGWTIPMTGPGSPARDRILAYPQPLKSWLQLDHKIQVAHPCIAHFCAYKTAQTPLKNMSQDSDSEFQYKVWSKERTIVIPLLLDRRL